MTDTSTSSLSRSHTSQRLVPKFALPTYRARGKRLFDLGLSLCLLPMLLPLIALLYFIVRLDGGSGFFGHRRIGRHGRSFPCWKLRTMVPNAEERLDSLLAGSPDARAEWEKDRKLREDPRVTALGHFLRTTSLDELPQIWNVLRGDMSLIGPRPVTEEELERYGRQRGVYTSLRPGITGLWQVSGRNDTGYDARIALDARYKADVSLQTDLAILYRTIGTVLRRTGY